VLESASVLVLIVGVVFLTFLYRLNKKGQQPHQSIRPDGPDAQHGA
jgi:hypothetical protein